MSIKNKSPNLYIIAGPNGAGKTTFAKEFLPHYAKCENFVNADLIAGGLAPFSPETAALRAGRLLLEQIRLLASKGSNFGFETTLAGVTYASLLRKLRVQGYRIHLFFLWIPTVEMALARIADRVRRGGHEIPEPVVRRRFHKGIDHLFRLYRPLLDTWTLFDNSGPAPRLVAREEVGELQVFDDKLFARIQGGGEGMKKNSGLKRSVHLINLKAEKALKKAVAETIRDHARTGDPVVIWRDGKVTWIPASRLLRKKARKLSPN